MADSSGPRKSFPLYIRILDVIRPVLFGGMAGITATTCIQPMDCIKVRMQLEGEGVSGVRGGMVEMGKQIIKNDGFFGLYRGYSAAFMRQAIYGSARMGLFRVFSDMMKGKDGAPLPFYKKAFAGLTSGALGAFIGNPCDLVLVRMQADLILPEAQRRNYRNFFQATYRILMDEGLFVLWRGALPTIYRGMAMNLGMMASYDQYKELSERWIFGEGTKTSKVFSSACAGMTATVVVLPIDMIKTRLQKMKKGPDGINPYKGFVDCAIKVATKEGPLAFWKGFSAFLLRVGPHCVIALLSIEFYHAQYDSFRSNYEREM